MSSSIKNVYNSGIGENLTEVADVAAMVKQQFGDIDDKSLEQITQDAITMSSVFDSDLNETLRGVNALMSNMGLTAEEAQRAHKTDLTKAASSLIIWRSIRRSGNRLDFPPKRCFPFCKTVWIAERIISTK